MRILRIGVIGTGFIGKQHIEAIRRAPATHIAAVADSNIEGATKVAEQWDIKGIYSDYREMLEKENLDIVHNCTPTAFHFDINRTVIANGTHIYSEKPLAMDSVEAAELARLAEAAGVANGVNFNYRSNAAVREMRERMRSGETGRPLVVEGKYLQDWLMLESDYDWRMDPEIGGKSRAVGDIGSHCFDTAQFVLDRRIVELYANLVTAYPTRVKPGEQKPRTMETEDAALIMARFEDGTPGMFHISQVHAGSKNDLRLQISASKGSLEWHQQEADKLHIGHRERGNERVFAGNNGTLSPEAARFAQLAAGHTMGWSDAFANGIREFYSSVRYETYREKRQSYATFADGAYVMKLVDCCLESARRDAWVDVASFDYPSVIAIGAR